MPYANGPVVDGAWAGVPPARAATIGSALPTANLAWPPCPAGKPSLHGHDNLHRKYVSAVQSGNEVSFHFMPLLFNASEYLAAFFKCSSYVLAKLCVPEKSSLAHIYR